MIHTIPRLPSGATLSTSPDCVLLQRHEVAALLSLEECIPAVEGALRRHAERRTPPPGLLSIASGDGGFHIKAAGLELARAYFALKVNGNFPGNVARFGLPRIQGVVVLCDGETGSPLALMDSIEITIQRTGAATAVAARHLARADSKVATICGCGTQGRIQLRALAQVLPLERAYVFDADDGRARELGADLAAELGIEVTAVRDPGTAVRRSDVCVTCTPATRPFLRRADVAPGTFIAAVGADSPEKQELDPALVVSSTIVVDLLDQAAAIGELHHALAAGLCTRQDVHAELGEVVAGMLPGRRSAEEIIVFDSTGTALQDAAAAIVVYEKAVRAGVGGRVRLAE